MVRCAFSVSVIQIDPARVRARHAWFVAYSDVLVQRLGAPAVAFRDGLRHAVPDTAGLAFERLHQNLLASHLAGNLLYGRRFFEDALTRLRVAGWLPQDVEPLADLFTHLVQRESVAERKEFANVAVNLLVWRMSVRIAAQVGIERIGEELADVWGDDDPDTLMNESIASAALPSPPLPEHDAVQARIEALASDPGFQRVMSGRLALYDEHAWSHPDFRHIIRPWLVASLVGAFNDAGVPGFSDAAVLVRCGDFRKAIADWVTGCTGVEATLLMPPL